MSLAPQLINGATLATEDQASISKQKGPYAGSEREKIAKDLIEFAEK